MTLHPETERKLKELLPRDAPPEFIEMLRAAWQLGYDSGSARPDWRDL